MIALHGSEHVALREHSPQRFQCITIPIIPRGIPGLVRIVHEINQLLTALAFIVENVLEVLRDDGPADF